MKKMSGILLVLAGLLTTPAPAATSILPGVCEDGAPFVCELTCFAESVWSSRSLVVVVQRRPGTDERIVSRFERDRRGLNQLGPSVVSDQAPFIVAPVPYNPPNDVMAVIGDVSYHVALHMQKSTLNGPIASARVRFSGDADYVAYQRCISRPR